MGRRSRQTTRQSARRQAKRGTPRSSRRNWSAIASAGIILLALVLFGVPALGHRTTTSATSSTTGQEIPGKTIDGTQCDAGMHVDYHVHAHLTILASGKPILLSPYAGHNFDHDCLYWLHAHDASDVIHIEAPHTIIPTLGQFFDVWRQPLSRTRVARARVHPGQSMKIYVDQKPYLGNPRHIQLHAHTMVTIEIGPPFEYPRPYNFHGL